LGESFLTWNGSHYAAHGSEGGHTDFAATEIGQIRLLEYMLTRFEHVSVERVCSGIGIPSIYEYFRDVEHLYDAPEVTQQIASAKDRTRAIIEAAVHRHRESQLCRATIEMFVSIFGSEAGNLALKV